MKKKYELVCTHCKCVKPPRTHHCSVCARCVIKMDHHCPWTNNCIGLYNQKAFVLFNFYTLLVGLWNITRFIVACLMCYRNESCSAFRSTHGIILMVIFLIVVVVFGVFTFRMFATQIQMIYADTSTIDVKKFERDLRAGYNISESVKRHIMFQNHVSPKQGFRNVMGKSYLYWPLPLNIGLDTSIENQLNNN